MLHVYLFVEFRARSKSQREVLAALELLRNVCLRWGAFYKSKIPQTHSLLLGMWMVIIPVVKASKFLESAKAAKNLYPSSKTYLLLFSRLYLNEESQMESLFFCANDLQLLT